MTNTDQEALIWMAKYAVCASVLFLGWLLTRDMVKGLKEIWRDKPVWLRKVTPLKLAVACELAMLVCIAVIIYAPSASVFWAAMTLALTLAAILTAILCLMGR